MSGPRKLRNVIGVDTETYCIGGNGLRSVQMYGKDYERYITVDDWDRDDIEIRRDICNQFFDEMEGMEDSTIFAMFNMEFDWSQFQYIAMERYEYVYDAKDLKSGQFTVFKTEDKMIFVKVKVGRCTHSFIDLTNFITGADLKTAMKQWTDVEKIDTPVIKYAKEPPTELDRQYAMRDAEGAYKIYMSMRAAGLFENESSFTIASLTMRRFQAYCKQAFSVFNKLFFNTNDPEKIEAMKADFERFFRWSLRGGITQAFQKGFFRHCNHIDAHSHYPSAMVSKWTPYGPLLTEKPKYGRYTYIVAPSGYFSIKPNTPKYMQWKSNEMARLYRWKKLYDAGEYVDDFFLNGSLYLWEDEWELIKETYDIEQLEIEDIRYIQLFDNRAIRSFIEQLYKGKMTSTGTKREVFKVLLNALYGKFASRPDGWRIRYVITEDGCLKQQKEYENNRTTFYLPFGSWIAMRGRVVLMRAAMSIPFKNLIYCDTDSLVYIRGKDPKVVMGKGLNEWELEGEDIDIWVVGPKTYQERFPDGRVRTKCAGLSKKIASTIPFGELKEGNVYIVPKMKHHPVTGAAYIEDIEHTVTTRAGQLRSRFVA